MKQELSKVNGLEINSNVRLAFLLGTISLVLFLISMVGCSEDKRVSGRKINNKHFAASLESDIVFGEIEAPVNIILFGNYECAFCKKFFKNDLESLLNKYKGQVKITYKIVPFSSSLAEHNALKMASSVFKYGNYKAYHSLLLKEDKIVYTPSFIDYLNEIMQYNQAIADYYYSDEVASLIKNNIKLYNELEIKGTPTFIIDNRLVTGYKTYKELGNIIEKLINK